MGGTPPPLARYLSGRPMSDPIGNLTTPTAYRSDGSIHALELDDLDNVKVNVQVITSIDGHLYGYTGSAWVALKVTASGQLAVSNVTASDLNSAVWGHDGSNYQKLKTHTDGRLKPYNQTANDLQVLAYGNDGSTDLKIKTNSSGNVMIDGDSPSLLRPVCKNGRFTNLALPAGASNQQAVTVPASEYWRLTCVSIRYIGTVAGVTLLIRVTSGAVGLTFYNLLTVVSAQWYTQMVNLLMIPSDILEVAVVGATLNDDLDLVYFAERVY